MASPTTDAADTAQVSLRSLQASTASRLSISMDFSGVIRVGIGFMAAGLGFGVYSFLRYRRETAEEKNRAEETGKTPEEE